jgi:hypothetical protein
MESLDLFLVSIYAMALMLVRNITAFCALLFFCLTSIVATYGLISGWEFYLFNALLFGVVALFSKGVTANIALSIVIFQYIMSWDCMIYPTTNTFLYSIYPVVSFSLNVGLVFSMLKAGNNYAGNDLTNHYANNSRIFNL